MSQRFAVLAALFIAALFLSAPAFAAEAPAAPANSTVIIREDSPAPANAIVTAREDSPAPAPLPKTANLWEWGKAAIGVIGTVVGISVGSLLLWKHFSKPSIVKDIWIEVTSTERPRKVRFEYSSSLRSISRPPWEIIGQPGAMHLEEGKPQRVAGFFSAKAMNDEMKSAFVEIRGTLKKKGIERKEALSLDHMVSYESAMNFWSTLEQNAAEPDLQKGMTTLKFWNQSDYKIKVHIAIAESSSLSMHSYDANMSLEASEKLKASVKRYAVSAVMNTNPDVPITCEDLVMSG